MAKPKNIIVTETALEKGDREIVAAYVAAKRAASQAEAVIKKTSPQVLRIANENPGLLIDGARIKPAQVEVWSYSPVVKGMKASVAAVEKEERENGTAKKRTTKFIRLSELAKFTGQALTGAGATMWSRLFG